MDEILFKYPCFWMIAQTTDTLKIYVSPEGNDSGTGTEMAPFKSFQQAVKTVVSSRAESPLKPVVVLFRGGSYPVTQTITVPSSASGTKAAPVIFRAAENEKPVFSGSVALTNWKPLKDASVAKRLSKDVAKHIVVVDLKSCGVTDFGKAVSDVNRPDLYCNGSLQTLARWPNCGFTYTGKARGATPTEKVWSGHKGTKEGIVEYCDSRINRWANEKDFKLHANNAIECSNDCIIRTSLQVNACMMLTLSSKRRNYFCTCQRKTIIGFFNHT